MRKLYVGAIQRIRRHSGGSMRLFTGKSSAKDFEVGPCAGGSLIVPSRCDEILDPHLYTHGIEESGTTIHLVDAGDGHTEHFHRIVFKCCSNAETLWVRRSPITWFGEQ